jgi:DNA adenine methylase
MLFARAKPAKVEVLNDINRDLVTLYRVLANHLDEFMRQFRWALTSREMFRWAELQHVDTLTELHRDIASFHERPADLASGIHGNDHEKFARREQSPRLSRRSRDNGPSHEL